MTDKTEKVKEGQLVGKKERLKMAWQPDINQKLGGDEDDGLPLLLRKRKGEINYKRRKKIIKKSLMEKT